MKMQKIVQVEQPKFDRLVAMWLIMKFCGLSLEDLTKRFTDSDCVEFRTCEHPGPKTRRRWGEENAYIIGEVGGRGRLLEGKSAAMEFLRTHENEWGNAIGKPAMAFVQKLAKTAKSENTTGSIRKFKQRSVSWLMLQAYKLGYPRQDVVLATLHVIEIREEAAWRKGEVSYADDKMRSLHARTMHGQSGDGNEPFTTSRYLRDMIQLGIAADEIETRMNFWININSDLEQAQTGLAAEYDKLEQTEFGGIRGLAIETTNQLMARYALEVSDCHVLMVTNPKTGQVAIFTNDGEKINLLSMGMVLYAIEGDAARDGSHLDRWHMRDTTRNGGLFNGTDGHSLPSTHLTSNQLITLIETQMLGFSFDEDEAGIGADAFIDSLVAVACETRTLGDARQAELRLDLVNRTNIRPMEACKA